VARDDFASEDDMRARDVRAIAFCGVTTLVLLVGAMLATHSLLVSLALTAAYAAWLLSRPRMIRVYRRLRGDVDWSGYFDNDGSGFSPRHEPGTARSGPRPAERR
jgi:hypothetical protein